jgi:hypothetical protein
MRIALAVASVGLACAPAWALGSIELGDMKDWTIVVAPDAIPSEQYAAREFQGLFKQATGAELPIAAAPVKTHGVYIGPGAPLDASPVRVDIAKLKDEGLCIRVKKHDIAIAGGRPRGTLYGVYEFFEKYVGARYLTCDDTYLPPDAAARRCVRRIRRLSGSSPKACSRSWRPIPRCATSASARTTTTRIATVRRARP